MSAGVIIKPNENGEFYNGVVEGNILPSIARTASPNAPFLKNTHGKDLYVIVDVTAIQGAVAEASSLSITAAPTSSGNVTPTLNGVGTPVAVTIGTAEVDQVVVNTAATTSGNITITLNGVGVPVAVLAADAVGVIGDKIRATAFTGWTTGGGAGTATVTFTKTTVGTNTAPSFTDTGATGVTATPSVTTAGVAADTTTTVATKIRGTAFTGWTTGGAGTTVTFTSTTTGLKADSTYSAGTTGATGTMTTTAQGTGGGNLTPKVSGIVPSATSKLYTLLTATVAITATGTYVYMVSKNAGAAANGITQTADAPLPKSLQIDMTHADTVASITYTVDYVLCM